MTLLLRDKKNQYDLVCVECFLLNNHEVIMSQKQRNIRCISNLLINQYFSFQMSKNQSQFGMCGMSITTYRGTCLDLPKLLKPSQPRDRLSIASLKKEISRKKFGIQIGLLVLCLTRESLDIQRSLKWGCLV